MKYIKVILVLALLMALLYLFSFISQLLSHDLYQYVENESVFRKYGYIISSGVEIIIFSSLVFIITGLISIVKHGYFNLNGVRYLSYGGVLFMVAGFVDILYCITSVIIDNNPALWLQRIFTDGLLIILGLVGLIVSDVIKKGSLLKMENDLTI